MTRLRRAGLAVLAALVAVATHAVPAAADMNYAFSDGENGVFSYASVGGGHDVQLNGEFAGVATGNTLTEFFWCAATATPDATDIALPQCSLGGEPAIQVPLQSTPGGLAVAVGTARFDLASAPPGEMTLCGTGVADFAEAIMGPVSVGATACTPTPTAVPSIPDPMALLADLALLVHGQEEAVRAMDQCLSFQTCVGPNA